MKYSMRCTCGDVVTVDASSKEEAVTKMQEMMSEEAINAHFAEKHPGQQAPSKEQSDAMVAEHVVEGELEQTPPAPAAV